MSSLAAFFLFILAAGAQFFTDWLLASYPDPSVSQSWMTIKPLLLIGGAMATLGFERLVLRDECESESLIRSSVPSIVAISAVLFVASATIVSTTVAALVSFSLGLYAICLICAELFRAKGSLLTAQIALNSWKVVAAAALFLVVSADMTLNPTLLGIVVCCSCLASLLLVAGPRLSLPGTGGATDPFRLLWKRSRIFLLFNVLLTLCAYGDQLIVGLVGTASEAQEFLRYFAAFVAPFLFLSGFLGFYLGTKARLLRSLIVSGGALALFAAAALAGFATILAATLGAAQLFEVLFSAATDFNLSLALAGALAGLSRLFYIIPSAVLGVLADRQTLRSFLLYGALGFAAQLVMFYLLCLFGWAVPTAMMVAVAINWSIRSAHGLSLVIKSELPSE